VERVFLAVACARLAVRTSGRVMQPSPYERTVAALRIRFRRQPVAGTALGLAGVWIAVNVYEATAHWNDPAGWFENLITTITLCATGIFTLAALTWLVERLLHDGQR
jgi:hypothetical protein